MTDPAEIAAVVAAARSIPPENFDGFEGVWPGEIATALIDAVTSQGAAFRQQHPQARDDLRALPADVPHRVHEVANKLIDAHLIHAADLVDVPTARLREIYLSVDGLGETTFHHFCLNLGRTGRKADRLLTTFLGDALNRKVSRAETHDLVTAAYGVLSAEPEHRYGATLADFGDGLRRMSLEILRQPY
ncbi:MAG: hypothetical protein Q4G50_04300 [Corynebacterium sp.]|uniref:hypothetical protein n=1 Tax=Corynebacterium sp. TaxID=1720 RepID=UPI0026DF52A9|nr:hypothetical protein [Corynebacterium sp.]MDO5669200.1 hypothetical protein [Corynebacterium sp.]